jgi:hypothetical protein
MLERRKFGPKGWNMKYPFSVGDLRDSALVMKNYMESNAASGKIPWDDLKYLIGEIMYGGHVVDDRDRIFVIAFLNNLMNDTLLDEAELFPFIEGKGITFKCPPPNAYEKYIEYIETECPPKLLLLSVWIQMLKLISELGNVKNFSNFFKKFNLEMPALEEVAVCPFKK